LFELDLRILSQSAIEYEKLIKVIEQAFPNVRVDTFKLTKYNIIPEELEIRTNMLFGKEKQEKREDPSRR